MIPVAFCIPGDLTLPTGGYRYDREVLKRFNAQGVDAKHVMLSAGYPNPSHADNEQTSQLMRNLDRKTILLIDGLAGGAILFVIASGQAGFDVTAGFASNGYGEHSPGKYSLQAALVTEVVMTFMFLIIILGATDKRAPAGLAPIAIGLGLTLIHLISIPVTNTSVNPARSTGVALFQGSWAISQLWLFWVAPIVGAALAGLVYNWLGKED